MAARSSSTAARSCRSPASDRLLGSYSEPSADGELLVVVFTARQRSAGLVVDEILDIVDDDVAHHSDIEDHGLLGSTVLGDRVTELLDVRAAILAADAAFYDADIDTIDAHDASDLVGAAAMSQYVTFTLDGAPVRHRRGAGAGGAARRTPARASRWPRRRSPGWSTCAARWS